MTRRPGCHRWRVTLRRGQRTWVILSHHWEAEEEHRAAALAMRRGAYELTAELVQPDPEADGRARRAHTGFQVTYCGPDTGGRPTEIPHSALFTVRKDQALGTGIEGLSPGAAAYLSGLYLSSLRDIRRTYQRAFKALLFCRRLGLSAQRQPHGTAELGYLLTQAPLFAGAGYYQPDGGGFVQHAGRSRFRLPAGVRRLLHPCFRRRRAHRPLRRSASRPCSTGGSGLSDYAAARADVRRRAGRPLWHLFEEAQEKQPAHPATCSAPGRGRPGAGRSSCATSRARDPRCTR